MEHGVKQQLIPPFRFQFRSSGTFHNRDEHIILKHFWRWNFIPMASSMRLYSFQWMSWVPWHIRQEVFGPCWRSPSANIPGPKKIFWKSVTMISCLGSFPTPDLLDISSLLRFGVLREQGLGAPLPDHFLTLGATGRGGAWCVCTSGGQGSSYIKGWRAITHMFSRTVFVAHRLWCLWLFGEVKGSAYLGM